MAQTQTAQTQTAQTQVAQQQTKGLKRNIIDKFYTAPAVVDLCITYIKQHLKIDSGKDLIIEPSAGNGSFIPGLKTLARHVLFYDLAPEHSEINAQDYLELKCADLATKFANIHIIGNPPFGRQSSLAIKFIKKSCEFADSISFILPKSFKKDSMQKSFPLKFHLLCEFDLPEKAFLVEGVEHDVPCVFQIWSKQKIDREVSAKLEPIKFEFVKIDENPDISFRRVGVNAGVVDTKKLHEKSVQSHYFIKFTNGKPVAENITKIGIIKYTFNNTVGPRSISKQELIKEFDMVL